MNPFHCLRESSRPPDRETRETYPDEQDRSNTSGVLHRPPSPRRQLDSGSHRLGRNKFRIQGNEEVEREVVQAAEPQCSEKKERNGTTVSEEHQTYRKDFATNSCGAPCRKAEPTPSSSPVPHPNVTRPWRAPSNGHSPGLSRKSDSSLVRTPDASDSRGKVGHPSDSVTSLVRTESFIKLPLASLSTQNQLKHVSGVSSKNSLTSVNTDQARISKCGDDSQLLAP